MHQPQEMEGDGVNSTQSLHPPNDAWQPPKKKKESKVNVRFRCVAFRYRRKKLQTQNSTFLNRESHIQYRTKRKERVRERKSEFSLLRSFIASGSSYCFATCVIGEAVSAALMGSASRTVSTELAAVHSLSVRILSAHLSR